MQHKRTFFFLEQLILKHGADEACVNVKEMHEVGGWVGGWSGWGGQLWGLQVAAASAEECDAAGRWLCWRCPAPPPHTPHTPPHTPPIPTPPTHPPRHPHPHPACYHPRSVVLQGVDFYFANRSHAVKFIDFLQTMVPIRYRCAVIATVAARLY